MLSKLHFRHNIVFFVYLFVCFADENSIKQSQSRICACLRETHSDISIVNESVFELIA